MFWGVSKTTISERLCQLRADKDLTQSQLAKIAGVSDKAISAWELGTRDPKLKFIRNICNHFGIDINSFIDESSENYQMVLPANMYHLEPMDKIPLLGRIACGEPILAEENIEDYIDLPRQIRADFALTCRGDSMINAGIRDGDIVYIRKQEQVENGQIVAVRIGDEEATLKRFFYDGECVRLAPENNSMSTKFFFGQDMTQVHVIGLAVAYTHAIEK